MTNTTQIDYLQNHLGGSLNTPLGTENIPHSMPVSATVTVTEPGAAPVTAPLSAPEHDRAGRSTVVWVAALVIIMAILGLFVWLR